MSNPAFNLEKCILIQNRNSKGLILYVVSFVIPHVVRSFEGSSTVADVGFKWVNLQVQVLDCL